MKKVIMKENYDKDNKKTINKVEDIINNYYYHYDKSRTVIYDKIWYYFKPTTTDIILYHLNDYSYNNYAEYICIYPTSLNSFVILVKEDNKINTIFKVTDKYSSSIKKYVIKDDTIFEFPAISVNYKYFFRNCLNNDLLLRTEFNEAKIADEISNMTGYNFRYPDKLKSNWTLYSIEYKIEDYELVRDYKDLIKRSDVYIFSRFNNSLYAIMVDEKTKYFTRIIHIERIFDHYDRYWSDEYQAFKRFKCYTFKIADYYIKSYDRFFVDNYRCTTTESSDLNDFFIKTLNNTIMNTKRNYKLEQDTFDLIKFINGRNEYEYPIDSPFGTRDFVLLLFLIGMIILILVIKNNNLI